MVLAASEATFVCVKSHETFSLSLSPVQESEGWALGLRGLESLPLEHANTAIFKKHEPMKSQQLCTCAQRCTADFSCPHAQIGQPAPSFCKHSCCPQGGEWAFRLPHVIVSHLVSIFFCKNVRPCWQQPGLASSGNIPIFFYMILSTGTALKSRFYYDPITN